MKTLEEVIDQYRQYNQEELEAIEFKKKHNDTPYLTDIAQIVDAKSLLKDGMIMIKKHPRFCVVKKHSHNYLEINYVLSGEIEEIVDGNKITIRQGEIIFLGKNSKHEFLPAKENDILLNFIILPEFFDFIIPFIDSDGTIKNFLINLLSDKESNNSIIFHLSNCEQVQNIVYNILINYEERDEKMNNILRYYFLLLIFELLKHTEKAEETKASNYDSMLLFKTYNYIENNYQTATLYDLSIKLKEDYNYLSKKIKKLTGYSFQNILEDQRLKVSKTLLESTDISVNDIAEHIGYNNLTFFYKLFKRKEGMTPLEYRLLNRL